ncbi:Krueppel homolog 1-like [Gigantopelta aegis]|uniref:Krueppel homolog 1-like n=1 Tax=Gigantopelta aegis TaxID=1735272 RepID=UPI001B887450|nr:Krueppel homolog 1-like [Gigantopelta aegis]
MEDPAGRNGFPPLKPRPANGPRPHRCEVCQRSFREVATLRKHEQLHRADRPYVCTTCGKSFLWSSNLKVHERVHTGERPYKCKICHRCFTQSNDLRRHERNVHMRGKLYGYKNATTRQNSHVNLAAYQAFAMQQRALLQQALTYESFMQNAAVASHAQMFGQPQQQPPKPSLVSTSVTSLPCRNLLRKHSPPRSPIKLEQVTPPSTPGDGESHPTAEGRRSLSTTSPHTSDSLQSPLPSGYASSVSGTSVIHSPPLLMAANASGYDTMAMKVMSGRTTPSYEEKPEYATRSPLPGNRIPSFEEFTRGIPGHHFAAPVRQQDGSILSEPCSQISTSMEREDASEEEKYGVCDSVMDLSVRKTPPSGEDETDIEDAMDMKVSMMPPPRTPESETDSSKRTVTTTSASPAAAAADSGIHHCKHCNIFFYDYTMFHLHQSLHSPYEDEYPFRCPSCAKNCQDRIEFMFHTVWHVKYPNTIPNYPSFRDSYLCT